jgi:hypothetical protein
MDRPGQRVPRPQIRHLEQEFERVRLRLDRIGIRVLHPADHSERARPHLEPLPFAGDGAIAPVASTAQPAVSFMTSSE